MVKLFNAIITLLLCSGLGSLLHAAQYPEIFAPLGTPLYKAAEQLSHISSKNELHEAIQKYQKDAKKLLEIAGEVSKADDKSATLAYLHSLRKLQKEYDYIIHLIHRKIHKAIKEDDYATFRVLTTHDLPLLLAPKALQQEAVAYYTKHNHKEKITLLEDIIEEKKLIRSSTQELYNQVKTSQLSSQSEAHTTDKKFYATTKKGRDFIEVFFVNNNLYDVTVQVFSQYKNIKAKKLQKNIFVVPAHSRVEYAKLFATHQGGQYSFRYRWVLGSKDAKHTQNYLYRLPYARGKAHLVAQGFNGKSTHTGSSKYAIDFQMDIGTKIYAARDGIVIQTKDDSNKHGFAKKFAKYGNHITILHDDGTFATYYHLKKGGVMVHVGQRVFRGEPIGYSGNTGYSSGPHLHFEVFHATSALKIESIPIRFISTSGVVANPRVGRWYRAK